MPLENDVLSRHLVRLFPSVRISSGREAEQRATSALLAIAKAVSEFGRALVAMAGGPRGRLDCYTEIPFSSGRGSDQSELRPDGLIHVERGKTEWQALVEVKVGDNPIDQAQFDAYHRLAKNHGIDAILTVSNQAALPNGLPPVNVDGRRLRSVPVTHLSWERLLSEARLLGRRKEINDPDQQWMLEEWIKYLADPASQIIEPPQLGEHWNEVLRAARSGNLQSASKPLLDVVTRWDSFERKVAMRLRAKLGVDVQRLIPRAERADPTSRIRRLHSEALRDRTLSATLRIPDAAGDVSVTVMLGPRTVRYGVTVNAPTKGRAKTRINWFVRQLRTADAPGDTTVSVGWSHRRIKSLAPIGEAMDDVGQLLRDHNDNQIPKDALPRTFTIESTTGLAKGRGRSTAPVLEAIAMGLERFYKGVVEDLRAYVPPPPRLAETRPGPETGPSEGRHEPAAATEIDRAEGGGAPPAHPEPTPG